MTTTMRMTAALMVLVSSAHADTLVGKVVPPFPDGMNMGGGTCVQHGEDPCGRVVSELISADGKKVGVYAAASDRRNASGDVLFIVTDLLPYPQIGKGRHLDWGSCRYDGVEDGSMVAVVRDSKREYLRAEGWAYRLDNASGKFIRLDVKRVDCFNTAREAD